MRDTPILLSVIVGIGVCVFAMPGPVTVLAALVAIPLIVASGDWQLPSWDGQQQVRALGVGMASFGILAFLVPTPLNLAAGVIGICGIGLVLSDPRIARRLTPLVRLVLVPLGMVIAGSFAVAMVALFISLANLPALAIAGTVGGGALLAAITAPDDRARVLRTYTLTVCCCAGLVAMMLPTLSRVHHSSNPSNCKNNLKQLGIALILYRDQTGGELYPQRNGSDFLIALYQTEVTTEPDLFLCPSSGDANGDGFFLMYGNSQATSYAGRRNGNQASYPGLFTDRGASETVLASDDSEGSEHFNHEDFCVMLFADGHVEVVATDDSRLDGVSRVGQRGTLLEPLSN